MIRCYDAAPDLLIPRFRFEYDHADKSFAYHISATDVAASVPLNKPPKDLGQPRLASLADTIASCGLENIGGSLTVSSDEGNPAEHTASLRLNPLPNYDVIPEHVTVFRERFLAQNQTRLPHIKARTALLEAFMALSHAQYQFGVPRDAYDTDGQIVPARFSLRPDYGHLEPVTIVSNLFNTVHARLRGTPTADVLSTQARQSIEVLDPAGHDRDGITTRSLQIATYALYAVGANCTCYGRRGSDELEHDYPRRTYRLQTGDVYVADSHNNGEYGYELFAAMLAVGSINKITHTNPPI